MINQKNDLNMITRKLEAELLSFHYDGLEISEITTKTSWMKLHVSVLFIKDDVQITKEMYKDYVTGLWYYIISDGMIRSHKDTYNHTIKKLIDDMIYDCHLEMEEVAKETTETKEINETENCESTNNGIKGHIYIDTDSVKVAPIPEICRVCPADRQGNRCGGEQWCKETWKRYEAITNPEWHNVSLATLANIDFDMLDKKRQVYLKAHRELKRTLADLSKCKTGHTYEARARKFIRDVALLYHGNEISFEMYKYLDLQLSMANVVNGVWSSYVEPATGLHESRRYGRPTLK